MLKDFFYLQRNDRQAILVLSGVIIVSILCVIFIGNTSTSKQTADNTEAQDSTHKDSPTEEHPIYYKMEGTVHELFTFDPNTADSTQLLKLGLQAWQARSIYRFRAKGGIFRTPSDFARLYGLTKKQYEVLLPYIHISDDYRPASDFYGKREEYNRTNDYRQHHNDYSQDKDSGKPEERVYSYPQKLKAGQHIAVNTADTTELMKIPGIGSYYAKSIVRYREQLGGYVSSSQLKEIEGLPETAFDFITINANSVKKLDINKLTLNQLRRHPYINFYQAKEICDYRRLRGPIKNLQELKLLKDFPPAEIERLAPYIEF